MLHREPDVDISEQRCANCGRAVVDNDFDQDMDTNIQLDEYLCEQCARASHYLPQNKTEEESENMETSGPS